LLFRGEAARADGWFARGARLLDAGQLDCVERGYMLIPIWLREMGRGDWAGGYATAEKAVAIGERFDDADLIWLARDEQARALVKQGDVAAGLRQAGEVLVVVESGVLSPIVSGIVYCNTIDFCRDAEEVRHAREWTEALTRWCAARPEMVAHNGLCLVHRDEMMQFAGRWPDAFEEAERAAQRYSKGMLNQIALGKAHYRQGEIHRLQGRFGPAEQSFRAASRCGCEPLPGLALLRLAQGRGADAAATIRRALAERDQVLSRAALLPAFVEILHDQGDVDAAEAAREELARIAEDYGTEVLTASAASAKALVSLAAGDAAASLTAARHAWTMWSQLDVPYEAARARVLVGRACRALGDDDAATLELDAAHEVFASLGAERELAAVTVLLDRSAANATHGLSDRELQVLRLVAAGLSNGEIGERLFVSPHTVARHLQNIFHKLGVGSRTAACAHALKHDLI
jgi:DNA-binding CsgD family transcriptional regulator